MARRCCRHRADRRAVHTSRPPVEVLPARVSATDEAIARSLRGYIGDGAVIQAGVGAVPDAILRLLTDRKDLGVHSGMIGDGWSIWSRQGC